MNNIYVETMPAKCKGCPLHNEDNGWCQVLICYTDDVPTECPLKLITDRLAEERKKVVQEIWQQFEQRLKGKTKDMSIIQVCLMINSVLDQIERETYE